MGTIMDHDENLDDTYNNAPCGYFTSLPDGTIVKINDTFLNYIQFDRDQVINVKRFQDLLNIGGKMYYETHYTPLLLSQKHVKEINFEIIRIDNKRVPVLINTVSVENEEGEIILNRSIVFDITQRKQYEQELLIAKRESEELVKKLTSVNKELGKFTSAVSHDIIGLIKLLDTECSSQLSESGHQHVELIGASAEKLRVLSERILGYYRGDQSLDDASDNVNLDSFVKNIASIADSQGNVQFNYINTATHIKINKGALERILLKLLINAIKYNNKDQVVIDITYSTKADLFHFYIKDNGIGIEKEHLEKIFLPLSTLGLKDGFDKKGTGIGLSSIKMIVEKLGGNMSVTSEINKGSTFSFTIKK
jgi:sigma-B regulation protein RsbU (phosphoserine phosphatase)